MKGFFAGSFNPFTIGHLDIVARAYRLCSDGLLVAIGFNEHKDDTRHTENLLATLTELFEGIPGIKAVAYTGLTADVARQAGADVLIRSYRNAQDAEYERNLADINRMIEGIDTILFPARPELAPISSSMIRELEHNGYDVSKWIPTPAQVRQLLTGRF